MLDVEQPASELDSVAAPTEAADPQLDDFEGDGLQEQQPEPEDIEEDWDGLKLRGKKEQIEERKKERMLHADYTRKTQEHADQRRAFDSERETFHKTRELHQQVENDKFQYWQASQRLQQLQQVNFSALRQTNPELAESFRDEMAQLSVAVPSMGQALNAKLAQLEQSRTSDEAKLGRQLDEYVAREFKGSWTTEKDVAMMKFVQKEGLDPATVRSIIYRNPQALRILDKAAKYDQMLAARFQKKPAELPKPATRVSGSSAATTKPLSEVTDPREWAERRREWKSRNR